MLSEHGFGAFPVIDRALRRKGAIILRRNVEEAIRRKRKLSDKFTIRNESKTKRARRRRKMETRFTNMVEFFIKAPSRKRRHEELDDLSEHFRMIVSVFGEIFRVVIDVGGRGDGEVEVFEAGFHVGVVFGAEKVLVGGGLGVVRLWVEIVAAFAGGFGVFVA